MQIAKGEYASTILMFPSALSCFTLCTMSNKKDILDSLVSTGFPLNYVRRAFKVFEKNYGHSYNVEVIAEIIACLQNKDKCKNEKNKDDIPDAINRNVINDVAPAPFFEAHLTMQEAQALQIDDKVDHRDEVGRFLVATVVEKQGSNLKIHYDGWSRRWDTWSDYNKELNRFAAARSVSERPAHKFTALIKGALIDINPFRHPGWKHGGIKRLDEKSGQVQVIVYQVGAGKDRVCWAHLDNENEVALFGTKAISSGIHKHHLKRKLRDVREHSDNLPRKKIKLSNNNEKSDDSMKKSMKKQPIEKKVAKNGVKAEFDRLKQQNMVLLDENNKLKQRLKGTDSSIKEPLENKENVNIKLKKERDGLLRKVDELTYKPARINAMSWEELNETKFLLQGKIKLIEEAETLLMNNTLKCVACMDNKKNISFSDGCDHFVLCDECESKMEKKECPICSTQYTRIKKLNV